MKYLPLFLFLLVGCNKKSEQIELKSENQKASYSIGQQIGKNFKQQNLVLSKNELIAGISDALEGKSLLNQEEIKNSMIYLQQEVMKKNQEKLKKQTEENNKFIETQKKTGKYKEHSSGVLYLVEKEGKGKMPSNQSLVKFNFRGTLSNGVEFDSSFKRNIPMEMKLSQMTQGLSIIIKMMRVGGKVKGIIPPNLGYGTASRPGIPANSVLLYDVELIDVK